MSLVEPTDTNNTPASSSRRYILLALKIGVSAALLVLLFSRIDVAELWASARRASIPWLLALRAAMSPTGQAVGAIGANAIGNLIQNPTMRAAILAGLLGSDKK